MKKGIIIVAAVLVAAGLALFAVALISAPVFNSVPASGIMEMT